MGVKNFKPSLNHKVQSGHKVFNILNDPLIALIQHQVDCQWEGGVVPKFSKTAMRKLRDLGIAGEQDTTKVSSNLFKFSTRGTAAANTRTGSLKHSSMMKKMSRSENKKSSHTVTNRRKSHACNSSLKKRKQRNRGGANFDDLVSETSDSISRDENNRTVENRSELLTIQSKLRRSRSGQNSTLSPQKQ